MSADTQAALIKFVESHLDSAKNFSVTWYGGEPLLTKDIIYNLSEKFLELCKNNSVEYDAFIVTNASLMTDADIDNFKKYQINVHELPTAYPNFSKNCREFSTSKVFGQHKSFSVTAFTSLYILFVL